MKNYLLLIAAVCVFLALEGCDGGGGAGGGILPASPSRSRYTLRLPEIPPSWAALLGEPEWRIEWLDSAGEKREMTVADGARPEIDLGESGARPVLAWPCWKGRDIEAGVFRPAGAIYPFDAAGDRINTSWQGGVDAALYWELAKAAAGADASRAAVPRLPALFNWPRFRELFAEGSGVNEAVRLDPWLADWPSIAAKIVASGFDKRRLVPAKREDLRIPVGPGPWIGTSPFAAPRSFEGEAVFPVRSATAADKSADTWVSSEGLLRCNSGAWLLRPWD